MKNSINKRLVFVLFWFITSSWISLFAQDWSTEQQKVWKNVETYNALGDAGDVEGYMAYVHPDYLGWSYRNALPRDKAATRKWMEYEFHANKIILSEIKPVGIKIHGDIAIVHYYFSMLYKDAEEKEQYVSGRWTDILMKQGDKWLLIGDHGGSTPKN